MMGCIVWNSLKWLAGKEEVGVGGGASEILTSYIENILQRGTTNLDRILYNWANRIKL
jgi:hypothetical protein